MLEIELPVDFIADLSAQATQIVADLFPIWALVGGIGLGLIVVAFTRDMFWEMLDRRFNRTTREGVQAQADAGLFDFDDDELMP